jgi:hypothetical protein
MDSTDHTAPRRQALLRLGADPADIDEFLDHSRAAGWWPTDIDTPLSIPDDDLPQIADWEEYAESAATYGAWNTLRERLVQLRFPVRKGISSEAPYRDATLRGRAPVMADDGSRTRVPRDPGAEDPLLTGRENPCRHSRQSTTISRASCRPSPPGTNPYRCPPQWAHASSTASTTGTESPACVDGGKRRRKPTASSRPGPSSSAPSCRRSHLYKDRIIILSRGAYSDVAADTVGVEEHEWLEQSLAIRLEHECIHALTLRVFGSLRHDLLEELVADWARPDPRPRSVRAPARSAVPRARGRIVLPFRRTPGGLPRIPAHVRRCLRADAAHCAAPHPRAG